MSTLEIRNISKSYRGKTVLHSASLIVQDGELFFLLGPSGCGKSTLLRILAGLLSPDNGEILLDGREITKLAPEKRNTPMVFQNYSLWPHLNVYENIAFGLRLRKRSSQEIDRKVSEMLDVVQLKDCGTRMITELSGGQQQRVALARALALEPPILLLDEPLSNLDAKLRDHMRGEIRRICKKMKLTALYVTHDRREALSMADRIAVFEDGGYLRQIASPREIYHHPSTRFVAGFLGDANLLDAVFLGKAGNLLRWATPFGTLQGAATDDFVLSPEREGTSWPVMFRPESLVPVGAGVPSDWSVIRGMVKESSYLGEATQLTLECGEKLVAALVRNDREYHEGEFCDFALPPESLVLLKGT